MVINNDFEIKEHVYLSTDELQKLRVITGLLLKGDGSIMYEVSCGTEVKWHYSFEISKEKNVVFA